jgi:hypothetical protein
VASTDTNRLTSKTAAALGMTEGEREQSQCKSFYTRTTSTEPRRGASPVRWPKARSWATW